MAQALSRLLGVQAQPRLARRLRDWPQLAEESEDICQLAAVAFLEAYRSGRIQPDAAAGEHTARSVAAYAWGICNRIFAGAVRSRQPRPAELDPGDGAHATDCSIATAGAPLEELLGGGPGDAESRLWEVLSSAAGRCRPEDIIMTYLLSSGVSVAEVRQLLGLSTNTPANAVRRVGRELRALLGLEGEGRGPRGEGQGEDTVGRAATPANSSGAGVPARHPDAPRDGRATVMDKNGRPMGRPYPDASGDARATKTRGKQP